MLLSALFCAAPPGAPERPEGLTIEPDAATREGECHPSFSLALAAAPPAPPTPPPADLWGSTLPAPNWATDGGDPDGCELGAPGKGP